MKNYILPFSYFFIILCVLGASVAIPKYDNLLLYALILFVVMEYARHKLSNRLQLVSVLCTMIFLMITLLNMSGGVNSFYMPYVISGIFGMISIVVAAIYTKEKSIIAIPFFIVAAIFIGEFFLCIFFEYCR